MNCPVCLEEMQEENLRGVSVNNCRFCGGLWLDSGELAQFVNEGMIPSKLLNSLAYDKSRMKVEEGQRACPRCGDWLRVIAHKGVNLDFCERCRGVWFDGGELKTLATRYVEEGNRRDSSGERGSMNPVESAYGATFTIGSQSGVDLNQELLGSASGNDVARALPGNFKPDSGKKPVQPPQQSFECGSNPAYSSVGQGYSSQTSMQEVRNIWQTSDRVSNPDNVWILAAAVDFVLDICGFGHHHHHHHW